MLESGKFFDSLQGKLIGILIGTLTFGAVVPALLDYLQAILYYKKDEHPVDDFQLISVLYFLLPALAVAIVWPFILKADGATHLLPRPQQLWARWLPVGGLLALVVGARWLFFDLSHLPASWVAWVCGGLLIGSPLAAGFLVLLVNVRLHNLPVQPAEEASPRPAYFGPVLRPRRWLRHAPVPTDVGPTLIVKRTPEAITFRQMVSVVSVPFVAMLLSLALVYLTFERGGPELRNDALKYAGHQRLQDKLAYGIWQDPKLLFQTPFPQWPGMAYYPGVAYCYTSPVITAVTRRVAGARL